MKWIAAIALALTAACGGAQATNPGEPCQDVAAHLVKLALQDNDTSERPTDMDGAEREFNQQCTSSPWSAERRACLVVAMDQEQTLRCPLD